MRAAGSGSTRTASCRATSTRSVDLTGVAGNFWLGLALLHTLFTREHNAIADRLAAEHPDWTDDELFAKARLITAALMAKIHTVEWTPAIIAHPTTKFGMRANWYGILGKRLGKRSSNEVLGGIPGSATDHHGVPYSLTEEFVAVYRMHPLLPDDFTFRSIETDEVLQERTFRELGVNDVRARLDEVGLRRRVLLVRDRAPGRDHAAQLPALPAGAAASRTAPSSTSRRSTSSASASAACRATTSSGGCST